MTYIVKNRKGAIIQEFDDIVSAMAYVRYLAWEDCKEEYMTWQVNYMFEQKLKSPNDIPEIEKELKQHELINEREKLFIMEGKKNESH